MIIVPTTFPQNEFFGVVLEGDHGLPDDEHLNAGNHAPIRHDNGMYALLILPY